MKRIVLGGVALVALGACGAIAKDKTQIAASAEIGRNITLFELPKGSRPHDVAPAPDGKIWYTAQGQAALGILDPVSGKVTQVPLGKDSSPHGVIQGPDGMAWITDSGQNAIVRYNPATAKIDVWKLPADTGYTNLNTGAFDGKGMHWFTGQNGVYGRADATTGKVEVWKDPKGRGPYGIATAPDGTVWYVSLAGSHLAKIDSATGQISVIESPTAGAGLRRVWADSKGDLWLTGWNSGELYRYRPASKAWKTWKLPGDAPKAYAVYVDDRDKVWVSDFGDNSTRVFDPRSEKFVARYPGSGEGANVRQILGRKGVVYLPESGTERMMVVRTDEK
jgi:virginiamycin B lyase